MANIHSIETLRDKRRQGTIEEHVPFILNGQTHDVQKRIVNGEMETFELARPAGEMLTNEQTRRELLEKVVLDVELGREQVPILYRPIYQRIENSDFPKEFEAKWAQYGSVIFFEHMEGEEVKFGSLQAEEGPIARIRGYSAGFEYTKELSIFNQTFNLEMLNQAFGEAHNAILNHLHLGPFIDFQYKAANKTGPVYVDENGKKLSDKNGAHYILSLRATMKAALQKSREKKRPGTILLANSADQYDINDALSSFTIGPTPYKALEGVSDIIYYDGWETQVGQKSYTYKGVPSGKRI